MESLPLPLGSLLTFRVAGQIIADVHNGIGKIRVHAGPSEGSIPSRQNNGSAFLAIIILELTGTQALGWTDSVTTSAGSALAEDFTGGADVGFVFVTRQRMEECPTVPLTFTRNIIDGAFLGFRFIGGRALQLGDNFDVPKPIIDGTSQGPRNLQFIIELNVSVIVFGKNWCTQSQYYY